MLLPAAHLPSWFPVEGLPAGSASVLEVTCGAGPALPPTRAAAAALECRAVRIWAAVIVVVGMGSGCKFGPYTFVCTDNAACGAGGICEGNGFCSFPDITCPSRRRFGDLGGPSAGQCVGGQSPVDGGDTPDGNLSDAGPFCYGNPPYNPICFAAPPTGLVDVSKQTTFDTVSLKGTGTMLTCVTPSSGGDGDCVIAADTITINAPLRATGVRPLVLVAADSISVAMAMSIDVGSHRMPAESLGAGFDPDGCNAGTPPTTSGGTSGGGAGGSFIGAGGDGGSGAGGGTGGIHGTVPGIGTILGGGCPGQDGAGGGKGARGHGGGAVLLIAGNMITVDGTIEAGGEGGAGAFGNFSGGGGGGAGGMIGLYASSIIVNPTAILIANGGGGGEGSTSNTAGMAGADSTSTDAALGGSSSTFGGNGGTGSVGAGGRGTTGMDGQVNGGGGGGGGGAGLIKGATASLGNKVSPAATP